MITLTKEKTGKNQTIFKMGTRKVFAFWEVQSDDQVGEEELGTIKKEGL